MQDWQKQKHCKIETKNNIQNPDQQRFGFLFEEHIYLVLKNAYLFAFMGQNDIKYRHKEKYYD